MRKNLFLRIILIVLIIILAGSIGYLVWARQKTQAELNELKILERKNYSSKPLAECVDCERDGATWENKPCCTDSFKNDCEAAGGVIKIRDLHPVFTTLRGCLQKTPDAGKPCATYKDCIAGCELENAIKSDKCKLIKKEFTGDKNRFYGNKFYTATYLCNTYKPGACGDGGGITGNPGGETHSFKMENKILIETLSPGEIW